MDFSPGTFIPCSERQLVKELPSHRNLFRYPKGLINLVAVDGRRESVRRSVGSRIFSLFGDSTDFYCFSARQECISLALIGFVALVSRGSTSFDQAKVIVFVLLTLDVDMFLSASAFLY